MAPGTSEGPHPSLPDIPLKLLDNTEDHRLLFFSKLGDMQNWGVSVPQRRRLSCGGATPTCSSTGDYPLHMWQDKLEGKRSAETGTKVKSPLLVLAQLLPDTNKTGCRNANLLCYKRKASVKSAPSMSRFSNASI